jgi:CTP:molybdopterin cytidylyltransferase MocA
VQTSDRGPDRRTTVAVVLAAGDSTRFGPTPKLLADFRGRPLVQWAVEAARGAGCDEVWVVTGATDLSDVLPDDVVILQHDEASDGLARSLSVARWAAEHAGHSAMVVGLGDQPLVTAEDWAAVAASDAAIATATFDGARRPPVRLASEVWPLLPLEGDEGAKALFRSRPELVVDVPCDGTPVDIDTPEDLARWS